jgi:hypothetical protein
MGRIGIRYYASTWHPDDVDLVLAEPRRALPDDPFMEVWTRLPAEHPELLYLDKLWSEFQHLTGAEGDEEPRPCFRLFEGQVVHVEYGWIPWYRAITPDDVGLIAADLAAATEDDTTARFGPGDRLRPLERHQAP